MGLVISWTDTLFKVSSGEMICIRSPLVRGRLLSVSFMVMQ